MRKEKKLDVSSKDKMKTHTRIQVHMVYAN